jgi:hypothetical protein
VFATLTLRRSTPFSLPTWGAIGGFTLVLGLGTGLALFQSTHGSRAMAPPIEQIAFEQLVVSVRATPLDAALDAPSDAFVEAGVAAVASASESAVTIVDARTGKPRASLELSSGAGAVMRSQLAVAPADSGRWAVLDRRRGVVDLVTGRGGRALTIALPRGAWSSVAWDSVRRRAIVSGWRLTGRQTASDGRSIHEFDERGVEVAAHRDIAPIEHRLQASFNAPFVALDGSTVLSASNLSNEVLLFDRSSARERVVRVADNWFQPINWELPRQTKPATTLAEPVLTWLASQTMLTAVIPISRGRFVARFTQHGANRERYVYAVVDSSGHTRALARPTTVKLGTASGDTLSGIDIGPDGRARLFVGVIE